MGVPRNADFGDFGVLIPPRAEGCAPPAASFAARGRKQFSIWIFCLVILLRAAVCHCWGREQFSSSPSGFSAQ